MSSDQALVLPRRLAIRVLHAAQIAQPDPIRGIVCARSGVPSSYRTQGEPPASGETHWAAVWSYPQAAAVPTVEELAEGGLSLVISLNTKGVLEMRAWQLIGGKACEQVLTVSD